MNAAPPPPGIGHNDPLGARVAELTSTANRWLSERPELTTPDMAERCSAFVDQIRACYKDVEKARKDEKQPHVDAAKAVDDRYRPLAELLEKAATMMKGLLTAWLKKEQERQQAEARRQKEEADRIAAEAAAKEALSRQAANQGGDVIGALVAAEAAAKEAEEARERAEKAAAAPVNLKSSNGARTKALRTTRKAKVVDPMKALAHYRNHPDIAATVERLANADLRAGAEAIPGIEIVTEQVAA